MISGNTARRTLLWMTALSIGLASLQGAAADHPQPGSGIFQTPLTSENIDDRASAEWFDGAEHPLATPLKLRQYVWTQTATTAGSALYLRRLAAAGSSPSPPGIQVSACYRHYPREM